MTEEGQLLTSHYEARDVKRVDLMRSATGRFADSSVASASHSRLSWPDPEAKGTRRKTSSASTLPRHAWSAAAMQPHSQGRTYFGTRWRRTAVVLAACVAVALLWRATASWRSAGQGTAASTATEAGDTRRGFARVLEKDDAPSVQELGRQKQSPQQVIAEAGGEAARREPVKAVSLDPRPNIRRWSGNPNEKFLAYFPHSVSGKYD